MSPSQKLGRERLTEREQARGVVDPRVPERAPTGGPAGTPMPTENTRAGHEAEGRRHPPDEAPRTPASCCRGTGPRSPRDDLAEPLEVPDVERPVQAQLVPELLDRLGRALAAHHHEGRIAGITCTSANDAMLSASGIGASATRRTRTSLTSGCIV